MNRMVGVWCLGLVVLDFVYVVVGRLDCYFEDGLSYYDFVVGKLLVQEVGVCVIFFFGGFFQEGGLLLVGVVMIYGWLVVYLWENSDGYGLFGMVG